MTVTSTSIGTNTVDINVNGELNSSSLITAIDTFLVAQGWAQYDIITPTSAAAAYQRVYRAVNVDATYKYMQLFFYPWETKIFIDFYESWNATTHVGTNKCYMGPMDVGASVQYSYAACDVIIMATARWVVFQTFINNQPGPWVGAFECQRDAVEDTVVAGYPAWFATTSYKLGSGLSPVIIASGSSMEAGVNGIASYAVSFPRDTFGVGSNAAMHSGVNTVYWGSGAPSSGAAPGTWAGNLSSSMGYFGAYAWNTANKIISSFRPRVQNELHGRAIGPKFTGGAYTVYNKMTVPVDANYMYASGGTPTDHWVLPVPNFTFHGALQNSYAPSSGMTGVSGTTGIYRRFFLAQNGYYYAVNTAGAVHKINLTTLALTVVSAAGTLVDICYDGQYIWGMQIAVTGNLVQIDTNNSDTVTIYVAMPASTTPVTIACDDTNIWVGCFFSAQAKVMQITKATPTAIAFTTSLTGATAVPYPMAMTVDNDGNVVVACTLAFANTSYYTASSTTFFQVKPGGTQVAFGLASYQGMVGTLMVSPRKCLLVNYGGNGGQVNVSAYTVNTDTSTLSLNVIAPSAYSNPGNYYATAWFYSSSTNTMLKMSVLGGFPVCNTNYNTGAGGIGVLYVNTALYNNIGVAFYMPNYGNPSITDSSYTSWGEFKYNMYYGTNNTTFVVGTNLWRADDGFSVSILGCIGAGRLLLPV